MNLACRQVRLMWFEALLVVVAIVAGAVSAVTGFGIGSLLTPVLALSVETDIAVAAISIPHVIGTGLRFYLLEGGVDRRVLWSFGLTSAAGGLMGGLLHGWANSRWLTGLFAALLLFAAVSEMSGQARRMRFHGSVAWVAGALSGLLGGLVGNQGGIRSAALLGFNLSKETFVGTATAIALFVDGARLPVYLFTQGHNILVLWPLVGLATMGVVVGTLLGNRTLARLPEIWFRRVLALILAILGTAMFARAAGEL